MPADGSSGPPTDAARRARRALLMLTRCNQAVLRATGEDALYQEVCKLIVEVGGYRMCWIGVGEEDERRSVRPVASHGSGQDYLSTISIVWADAERGRGPTGTALRTGKPVLGRNFLEDPELSPWRAEALRRGFLSSSALPLLFRGERLGVMTMCVLYVSGHVGDALDRRGIHEGGHFLATPFTLTTLLDRVREVLDRS